MLQNERAENKAHLAQIKNLKVDLSIADSQGDKGVATQRLLKDKEGTIQLLKKKLEIPSTWLIQTPELIEIEKERENLNTELVNCKSKLLIQEGKRCNGRNMSSSGPRKSDILKQSKLNWKKS